MNEVLLKLEKEYIKAIKENEVPVACVIVKNNKIIASAHNTKENKCAINHAEINAIIKASKKNKNWRLNDCKMYVTLEPCEMCKQAIMQSRISEVNYILESNFNSEINNKTIFKKINCDSTFKSEYKDKILSFFHNKR